MKPKFESVDDYIDSYPKEVQLILKKFRKTIQNTASESKESIAYGMPAYKMNGKALVYFAAFSHHIGFYATPTGHAAFAKELSRYKQGKGSVQFPLTEPMPWELIKEIVKYRIIENANK